MSIWTGKKIRLRAPVSEDSVLFTDASGNADTDTAKLYDRIELPKSPKAMSEFLENVNSDSSKDDYLFTVETHDGTPVGQITAFECDRRNGCFKYGLFIHPDHKGNGYASEAAVLLLDYYFNQLRYHKANVYIYECNAASIAFHTKLGFKEEGLSRESAYFDGEYRDIVYMGMLDREFAAYHKK
ncbi:MAG: GNAT family N-acetyltransferase [Clostridia bacterium]|nr:GNAT family N-acetyltransferase [Clostridia bacterium]